MDQKVIVTLADAVASCIILLATRWASPQDAQLVKELVLALQPAVIVLVGALTYQDVKETEAYANIEVAKAVGVTVRTE